MFDLSGKVALVTGAGQGMGAGMAMALARQGAKVAVNDFYPDRSIKTVEAITARGGTAASAPFDVRDREVVGTAIRSIGSTLGPVDILVNNAGVPAQREALMSQFRESSPDAWRPYIDLNIYRLPRLHSRGHQRHVRSRMGENHPDLEWARGSRLNQVWCFDLWRQQIGDRGIHTPSVARGRRGRCDRECAGARSDE